jgi:hypothetical protein
MLLLSEHLGVTLRDGLSLSCSPHYVSTEIVDTDATDERWRMPMLRSASFSSGKVAFLFALVLASVAVSHAQVSGPPSSNCHVTDGTFTACSNGKTEWSDVTPVAFPASNSYLYVNQDAAHKFLYLMYDLPLRMTTLAATDSVHIHFDTVETQSGGPALVVYDIDLFGDGQVSVLENGQPTPLGTIVGAVGFGPSPNSATSHVTAELQVPLAAGLPPSTYSSEPLFWGASLPPTPPSPPPCAVKVLGVCIKTQAQVLTWNQEAAANFDQAAFTLANAAILCPAVAQAAKAKADADWAAAADQAQATLDTLKVIFATKVAVTAAVAAAEQVLQAAELGGPDAAVAEAGLLALEGVVEIRESPEYAQVVAAVEALAVVAAEEAAAATAEQACEITAQAVAASYYAAGQAYLVLAQDPPDSNFTVIATPAVPSFSVQPFTTAAGFSQQLASDLNALFSNFEQQIALLRVIPTTLNRETGAIVAGNAFWQGQQTQAVQNYASQLVPLLQNELSLRTALANDFASSGVTFTFSPNNVANTLSLIKQNGFPADVTNALTQLGVDAPTQSTILQTALSTDPVLVASLGTGAFPQALSDPSFITATKDAVNAFAELAAIPFTYTYSGKAFQNLYSGFSCPPECNLSGSFTVAVPLGPDLANSSISPTSFGYTDGPVTITNLNATGSGFSVSTDSGGAITAWDVYVEQGASVTHPAGFGFVSLNPAGTFGNDYVYGDCTAASCFILAQNLSPGSWSVSQGSSVANTGSVTTATSAVVEANPDGDTVANRRGLAPTDAPTLQDQIQMIVQFRVIQNPSTNVTQLTTQLVNSLPPAVLPPSQAASIIDTIAKQVTMPPDRIPPVTSATQSPGLNANGWNNSSVTITFNSTDNELNGTGVKQIAITLSGAQSSAVVVPGPTASVQITAEGITTVTYFGTDNAGNQEAFKTLTVKIDKTPPVISGMPALGCIVSPLIRRDVQDHNRDDDRDHNREFVQIATVTASDALSGIATFIVTGATDEPTRSLDSTSPDIVITHNGPATYTVQVQVEPGNVYTLTASASDLAGNASTSTTMCTVPIRRERGQPGEHQDLDTRDIQGKR